MIDADNLERSKAIQQRTGRTFHLATRLLPQRIRHATYVLYAFFRIADDVVDDPDPPPAERQLAELERIRESALGTRQTNDPVLEAFLTVRDRYDIPDQEIDEFVDAMARDVSTDRYETHDELSGYLRGSSVAVANMMLCVMDPDDSEAARPHAKALAEALQLTNFLRDVREDVYEYDRIYLPRARREGFGVSETQIANLECSPEFEALIRDELARTERRYETGVDGIAYLPEGCQFAVLLAAVLYADHHRAIRAQGCDVLSERPSLSMPRRLFLAAKTWWHWRRTDDPRTAFDAASSIPTRDGGDRPIASEHRSAAAGPNETDHPPRSTGDDSVGRPTMRRVVSRVRAAIFPGESE
ncbi:phytoene/squalene synthetase [Halovivax ruber XH-70]|uniref:Phytoene/squalene synthetase n=1 Tax=Halovivax ruber (strain DSM 18193 / JCM 13892 / XH-70) TaxID=797302 RepID=L0I8C5_HALRX|nr:phytoene/squalene synthase family protein [Halovivax ruber]AGB15815.1 phytoene/squalene synthetase [Halovivax ruber XH-70]